MKPLHFWLMVVAASLAYQVARFFLVGSVNLDQFFGAVMWVGYSMVALHYEWVKP